MAQPNGKTNGVGHHEEDKSQKQSKLRQLLVLAKEVAEDSEALLEYDTSAESRKALKKELEAKKSETQRLREFNDKITREYSEFRTQTKAKEENIFSEFEKRYKRYDSNNAAVETMQRQVAEARAELHLSQSTEKSIRDELDGLKTLLEATHAQVQQHAAAVKTIRSERDDHRNRVKSSVAELDACKAELAEVQSILGDGILKEHGEAELRELGQKLLELSQECHNLVKEYCNDVDGAKDSAGEIQDLKSRYPLIPLTTASTTAAARMRCAVAEAVIASILVEQIFVPFYLPSGKKEAAAALLDIFGDDKKLQSVYRCQILRSATKDAEEARRVEDEIIRRASSEVKTTLHALVVASKQASFFAAVPPFFRKAVELWSEVQRSRDFIFAERPDATEVQPPGKYADYDAQGRAAAAAATAAAAEQSIAADLFPPVATREDLIFHGMALWSTQTAGAAAAAAVATAAHQSYPPLSNGSGATNGEGGKLGHHVRRKSIVGGADSPLAGRGRHSLNGAPV